MLRMPFRRRRIKRVTMGKDPIKHSATRVSTIGGGSLVDLRSLIQTNAGDRSLDGTSKVYGDSANTGNVVMVSDIVKYVNIILQAAITDAGKTAQNETQGWIEWAVVWRDEVDINIPSTNLGTRTLGDIAINMFRGDCIMTGQFPVSVNLPNVQEITIKLPKKAVKWHIGDQLILYSNFRDSEVTNLDTDTVRLIQSHIFKSYS